MSENLFEQLAELVAELQSPDSRRRRHLRRRLSAVPQQLLEGAVEECFIGLLLDADERFLRPLEALLGELNRRTEVGGQQEG